MAMLRGAVWIRALATTTPERVSATEAAQAIGVDVSGYRGWPYYHRAGEGEHPSTMGAAALGKALAHAGLEASELDFILFTGMSRDYLPSWCVGAEIARLLDCDCVAWDLTIGCLGPAMGLETAAGWLAIDSTRRLGAVVAAERWAFTVDREDPAKDPLWAHADGACAMIVGAEPGARPVARYEGLSVVALPEMNGFVKIKYGGTRHPLQEGDNPFERQLRGIPKRELFPKYMSAFEKVIGQRKAAASVPATQAVCNQVSPNVVRQIEGVLGFAEGSVPRTGLEHGHVGGCDTVLGLEALIRESGTLVEPTMLLASSPYTFSAASLYPAS